MLERSREDSGLRWGGSVGPRRQVIRGGDRCLGLPEKSSLASIEQVLLIFCSSQTQSLNKTQHTFYFV